MLSAIVNGTEYSLDDGTLCTLVGYEGWGSFPVERLTSEGPMQDGDTDLGFKVKARTASLAVMFHATELSDMYVLRDQINALFAPGNSLTLKWALPYGDRMIDVKPSGNIPMPWVVNDWAAQTLALVFRAADPSFYDPNQVAMSFGLTGGGTGWPIPWIIPWTIGTATLDQRVAVTYTGRHKTYPIIRIIGPITNPKITNETTGDVLFFDGITISAGNYYEIDCRYGYKIVTDSGGTDRTGQLTDASDIDTFRIETAPIAMGGINSIRVEGSSVNTATQVYMNYYNRFTGI